MSDWLKKANEVLGDLAGQAGRQAEIVQLQAKLGRLDNELDQVYVEAGKRAEQLIRERRIHDDELRVILERAREINEAMMEVRQQVQDLRQKPEQPESTAEEAPPSPQPSPQPQPEATATSEEAAGEMACPSCGGEVTAHMVFCPHCGEKQGE
jgi:DNA repair exonuclease SbcCD ATPase subunit